MSLKQRSGVKEQCGKPHQKKKKNRIKVKEFHTRRFAGKTPHSFPVVSVGEIEVYARMATPTE